MLSTETAYPLNPISNRKTNKLALWKNYLASDFDYLNSDTDLKIFGMIEKWFGEESDDLEIELEYIGGTTNRLEITINEK
jgi:hypothetical protein